jgi:lipopolysaccharide export system permease protein
MILTSYIFKQTFNSVCMSTMVFIGVIWLSQSFKTIKLIINKGGNLSDFFILSAYSFPSWLLIALPFGTFAGCMISYFKFKNDREIIVMKVAGLNSLRISKPAILVALVSSLILLVISHIILPITYKNFKILQNQIRNNKQTVIIKDNLFIDINNNQTIFIGKLDYKNYFEEIFIQDRTDLSNIIEYFSKSGYLEIIEGQVILFMNKGTRISTDLNNVSTILDYEEYNITMKKDKLRTFAPRIVEYNEYSFFDLINKAKERQSNKGKLLAEAHNRNTVTFLPIIFTLIVMITTLTGNFSRSSSIYPAVISISILIMIQTVMIIVKNLVHSNLFFLPLMYIFPISIFIIGIIILYKDINIKKVLLINSRKTN